MSELPAHFVQTIIGVHGEAGAAWIADFPQILAAVAARYDLTLGPPFKLSYNYVCAATRRDGTPVVLKLSPPYSEFYVEVAALRHYGVRGCVELLDADPDAGIVILERIFPGETLEKLADEDDDAATHIIADVMTKLWQPLPADHNFPTIAKWSLGLQRLRADHNGTTGPLPVNLVARAEAIYRDILTDPPPPVLLHGDLHHDNVLRATRVPYLAIDPKGLAGEPAYEVGPLFYNPLAKIAQTADLVPLFARRLAILTEHLPIPRERLLACAFAHAVLSAAWSIEDDDHDDGWQQTLRVAEALRLLTSP